jgi:hypothetical protein
MSMFGNGLFAAFLQISDIADRQRNATCYQTGARFVNTKKQAIEEESRCRLAGSWLERMQIGEWP